VRLLRDAFGEALLRVARQRPEIVVLTADMETPTRVAAFAAEFPQRFFQVGIAEQNMIGIAAGLAASGKIPVVATLAVFATRRVLDQVAISVAYPRMNVKIMSTLTGLYASKTGATHQAMEDIAIMRVLPNMTVVVPADPTEVGLLLERIIDHEGPVYFRVASIAGPDVFGDGYNPVLGRAEVLREGRDITLIATGLMTARTLEAAQMLQGEGIDAAVLHVHTVKPIDAELIAGWAARTGAVVTAENHRTIGGLGSAVAEVLVEHCPVAMRRVAISDVFGESGSDDDLTEKYGLSSRHVAEVARQLLHSQR
jgi:transketolase